MELISEGSMAFRVQNVDPVVVVPIRRQRPQCRLALATCEFGLYTDVLAPELPITAFVEAHHLVHQWFRDEAACSALRTPIYLE